MSTGDIRICEEETGHIEVVGRYTCRCGYKKFPCRSCGELEVHKDNCEELAQRRKQAHKSYSA